VENIVNTRKSLAKKHIIVSGKNDDGNALVVQETSTTNDGSIQAPDAKGGIYLSTNGAGRAIRLDTPKTTITMNDAGGLKLEHKEGKTPSVTVKDASIELAVNGDKTSVILQESSLAIKCGDGKITVTGNKIEMDNSASEFRLGKFSFKATGEIGTDGALSLSAGSLIKIG
jgi:hypothetical protein